MITDEDDDGDTIFELWMKNPSRVTDEEEDDDYFAEDDRRDEESLRRKGVYDIVVSSWADTSELKDFLIQGLKVSK
jgi:hypothetical protein